MGVAIPFTLRKRCDGGEPVLRTLLSIFKRYALLVIFALLNQHLRPYVISSHPTQSVWIMGVIGFLLVASLYVRLPDDWPKWTLWAIRVSGVILTILIIGWMKYPSDVSSTFSLKLSDPIILVLAACSLFGSLIWLGTQSRPKLRAAIVVGIACVRVASTAHGSWAEALWNSSGPVDWCFKLSFLQYLLVTLPGTVVGDWIVQRFSSEFSPDSSWTKGRWLQCLIGVALVPIVLGVLYLRIDSWVLGPLTGLIIWLGYQEQDSLHRKLLVGGAILLAIGLCLEPFQGGIKKDPPTLSYVILTPGLAMIALNSLLGFEGLFPESAIGRYFAHVGSNALLAYEALTNLFAPLWALTVADLVAEHTQGPFLGMVLAVLQTLLFGLMINMFTSRKLFFRA